MIAYARVQPRNDYRSPVVYFPLSGEKERGRRKRVTVELRFKKEKKKKKDGTYINNRVVLATFLSMSKMFKC